MADTSHKTSANQQSKLQPTTSVSPNTFKTETKKTFAEPQKPANKEEMNRKSLDSLQGTQKSTDSSQKNVSSSYEKDSESSKAELSTNSAFSSQEFSQNQFIKGGPITIERWISRDGPQKLNESLARLNLNINTISKVSLSSLSAKQLDIEKKNVKSELKRYDAAFVDIFKRMPNREEKEPMRPLYIYYKRLKQYLSKAENEDKSVPSGVSRSQNTSIGNVSLDSDRNSRSHSAEMANKGRENKGGNRSIDQSFEDIGKDLPTGKVNSGGYREKSEKKMSKEEAQKRLDVLEGIKTQLREKLHAYQADFTKNNNRKIKYHKDIIPVEEEYKKYKEVKEEITSLEELLKS